MAQKTKKKAPPITFIPAPADAHATTDEPRGDKQESKIAKFWREQARPFLIMVLILFSMRSVLADWNVVPTGSMKPTIIEGDRIFVNKLAYDFKVPFTHIHIFKWGDPKRGEIVVFDSPADGTRLVKRVIGVPGDVLDLRNNVLYINGEVAAYGVLEQDIINQVQAYDRPKYQYNRENLLGMSHPVRFALGIPGANVRRSFKSSVEIPADHYFMMGDNRDFSKDSRFSPAEAGTDAGPGLVPRHLIVGRSSAVIMSLDYDDYYLPRKDRFFRKLP